MRPGLAEESIKNVQLHCGILFDFGPESCSESPGMPFDIIRNRVRLLSRIPLWPANTECGCKGRVMFEFLNCFISNHRNHVRGLNSSSYHFLLIALLNPIDELAIPVPLFVKIVAETAI
jgi:hypothetical protein